MMTSRAEYRLLLRQDNADQRLTKLGYEIGLISEERYEKLLEKERLIEEEIHRVERVNIGTSEEVQNLLKTYESTPLTSGTTLAELIRRPELSYEKLAPIDKNRKNLPGDVAQQVDINIKYDGYIKRQMRQVEQFKKLENKKSPYRSKTEIKSDPSCIDRTGIQNIRSISGRCIGSSCLFRKQMRSI